MQSCEKTGVCVVPSVFHVNGGPLCRRAARSRGHRSNRRPACRPLLRRFSRCHRAGFVRVRTVVSHVSCDTGGSAGLPLANRVSGVGFGLFQSPNLRLILSSAPIARSGAAGAMQNAARLLGQSLGATIVALLFRFFPSTGSNATLGVAAVVALAAAVASAARLWLQTSPPQPNEAAG